MYDAHLQSSAASWELQCLVIYLILCLILCVTIWFCVWSCVSQFLSRSAARAVLWLLCARAVGKGQSCCTDQHIRQWEINMGHYLLMLQNTCQGVQGLQGIQSPVCKGRQKKSQESPVIMCGSALKSTAGKVKRQSSPSFIWACENCHCCWICSSEMDFPRLQGQRASHHPHPSQRGAGKKWYHRQDVLLVLAVLLINHHTTFHYFLLIITLFDHSDLCWLNHHLIDKVYGNANVSCQLELHTWPSFVLPQMRGKVALAQPAPGWQSCALPQPLLGPCSEGIWKGSIKNHKKPLYITGKWTWVSPSGLLKQPLLQRLPLESRGRKCIQISRSGWLHVSFFFCSSYFFNQVKD